MKKMTCKQLGGACDKIFSGNTFKELANQSKADGKEMFDQKDAAHLVAMAAMQELMQKPNAMQEWFMQEFDALPEE
ncbi:MAG: hypothetical protein ACI94N_000824 [Candidatus Arcticimaribacter sp.]|jgi:hypothetical protein